MPAGHLAGALMVQAGFELEPHHPREFAYCGIQIADRFESDIVQCLPQAFAFISHGILNGEQQQFNSLPLFGCSKLGEDVASSSTWIANWHSTSPFVQAYRRSPFCVDQRILQAAAAYHQPHIPHHSLLFHHT
jgi:hypothetical protein